MEKWLRVRFKANADDPRPVHWPPPGPYWISSEAGDGSYAIVIAYVRRQEQILEFWPEATIDWDGGFVEEHDEIAYTDRFQRPGWYDPPPAATDDGGAAR